MSLWKPPWYGPVCPVVWGGERLGGLSPTRSWGVSPRNVHRIIQSAVGATRSIGVANFVALSSIVHYGGDTLFPRLHSYLAGHGLRSSHALRAFRNC